MTFTVARVETRNFEFTAYGATDTEAIALLETAWQTHKANTGAWLEWSELENDVQLETVSIGTVTIR
jgi:hypothetical protein